MTTQQARQLIETLKPNPMLPPAKRNKSWLFVYGEPTGALHFYDVKFRPDEALDRLNAAHVEHKRTIELLDVLGYHNPDEASQEARNFKVAQENIDYYRSLALNSATAKAAALAPLAAT